MEMYTEHVEYNTEVKKKQILKKKTLASKNLKNKQKETGQHS